MAFLNGLAIASPLRAVHVQRDAEAGSVEEHHYFGNGNRVQTSNTSLPILFNGKPIGTTELPANETHVVHSMSAGHHFYHEGWALMGKHGGSYHPRAKSSNLAKRIGTPEPFEIVDWTATTPDSFTDSAGTKDFENSGITTLDHIDQSKTFNKFDWFVDTSSKRSVPIFGFEIELFIRLKPIPVATIADTVGDLVNIFFFAVEIFA